MLGKLLTIKEWIYCLVSPRHADNTWLRIDPRDQKRALNILDNVNTALIVAILAVLYWGQMRITKHVAHQHSTNTIIRALETIQEADYE